MAVARPVLFLGPSPSHIADLLEHHHFGLHVRHGFWSAAQTLGVGNATRDRILKAVANVLAVLLTAAFISVPVGVMTGVVS